MSRILLVEDQEAIRWVIREILESDGHVVYEAGDGGEALQMLGGDLRPDLILTDLDMEPVGGLEFIERLRFCGPLAQVPLIIVSSEPRVADIAARLAVRHCAKASMGRAKLLQIVQQTLGKG